METLEAHQARTGTGKMFGVRIADNFHRHAPPGKQGLTDREMEAVARRDLGCSRRSTYRELGRGAVIPSIAGGRTRRAIIPSQDGDIRT